MIYKINDSVFTIHKGQILNCTVKKIGIETGIYTLSFMKDLIELLRGSEAIFNTEEEAGQKKK